jgi:hypothetical protein
MAEEMVSDVGPSHTRIAYEPGHPRRRRQNVLPSGGGATAAAIPGAELVVYPGMGHSLPRALWPDFAHRIATLIQARESRSAEVRGTADGNATFRMGLE